MSIANAERKSFMSGKTGKERKRNEGGGRERESQREREKEKGREKRERRERERERERREKERERERRERERERESEREREREREREKETDKRFEDLEDLGLMMELEIEQTIEKSGLGSTILLKFEARELLQYSAPACSFVRAGLRIFVCARASVQRTLFSNILRP